ncbi:MAG: inorganic phosphate transporter [Pseudomonadota bacterium]|nr:inorganic phosphate transporter [Pseudomonadota bacterium]
MSLELVLTVLVGFIMAWAVGANDVANAMASTVGSKTLSVRTAVIVAAVFEAIGAICASGQVTNMIRYGIIDVQVFSNQLDHFVVGMLSALMSAASWLLIATHFGWPVSTTHSIIGAVLGFGVVSIGMSHILWWSVAKILLSWVLTPLCAVFVSYFTFILIGRLIFSAKDPIAQANWLIPTCMMLLVFIFSGVTIFQGLDVIGIEMDAWKRQVLIVSMGGVSFVIGWLYTHKKLKKTKKLSREKQLNAVEKKFAILSIMTAASMAYAHGSNDVANAIGPVAAVVQVLQTQSLTEGSVIPTWVVFLGASGIVLGLMMYGYKIMETVGSGITQLTPSRGFTAQFSTSAMIVVASGLGYPVSTTQTMVGSILGVGLARGMTALNLNTIKSILVSWSITVPVGAIFAGVYYWVLSFFLL